MNEESIWIMDFLGKCIREKAMRDEPELVPEYTDHDLMLNQDNLVEYEAYIKSLRSYPFPVSKEQDGKELREGVDFRFEHWCKSGFGISEKVGDVTLITYEVLTKCRDCYLKAIPIEPETKIKNMKSGIELIAIERQEQIEKHGRSISQDVAYNSGDEKPLTKAASALTIEYGNTLATEAMKPSNWDEEIWQKMMGKSYKDRLIIAGALIAAEIDRLQSNS